MVLSLLEEQEYKRYIEAFDFSKYMKDKTFLITGSNGMCFGLRVDANIFAFI